MRLQTRDEEQGTLKFLKGNRFVSDRLLLVAGISNAVPPERAGI
jgi:hypothetical protein